MTLFVPFDGSELAEAALVRAAEFGEVFEESVLAVSVAPRGNTEYARERDWISPREDFNLDEIVSELHVQVVDLAPSANFRHKVVGQHASSGTISKKNPPDRQTRKCIHCVPRERQRWPISLLNQ